MSVILVTISFMSFMKSRSILADPSLSLLFSVLCILRKKCSQSFFSSRLSSRRHWLKSSSFVFSCIRNLVLNSVIWRRGAFVVLMLLPRDDRSSSLSSKVMPLGICIPWVVIKFFSVDSLKSSSENDPFTVGSEILSEGAPQRIYRGTAAYLKRRGCGGLPEQAGWGVLVFKWLLGVAWLSSRVSMALTISWIVRFLECDPLRCVLLYLIDIRGIEAW
jgi:hypothetical protein